MRTTVSASQPASLRFQKARENPAAASSKLSTFCVVSVPLRRLDLVLLPDHKLSSTDLNDLFFYVLTLILAPPGAAGGQSVLLSTTAFSRDQSNVAKKPLISMAVVEHFTPVHLPIKQ